MRVIAGKARRTPLKTIEGLKTRPTTDRIKETLFNIINSDMYDAKFMDLFSGSGGIGDVYGVHFGRPLVDGTYSDSRVLSIAEILKLIGLEDDFLDPLIAKGTSAEDFDGLTFENNMLIGPDEKFIREVLGEHVCPKFLLNLMSTLPIPANDNEPCAEEKTDSKSAE